MWSFTSNNGNIDRLGMNLGSATNLQHQYTSDDHDYDSRAKAAATYVLMRKDTANAMPIVIASSLLIENLEPELDWLSPSSSVPCRSGELSCQLVCSAAPICADGQF